MILFFMEGKFVDLSDLNPNPLLISKIRKDRCIEKNMEKILNVNYFAEGFPL